MSQEDKVQRQSFITSSRLGERSRWRGRAMSLYLLAFYFPAQSFAQSVSATDAFGGAYSGLRPEQKRLIDDWFGRFSAVVKKPVNPTEAYDRLPLSSRTTFNAVTHALAMTRLSDSSGTRLAGSAIELVDKVDGLAGQILGARGDEQFRIYVQMKRGAMDLLRKSTEFKRAADNTVYHKGYPTCFRTKGVPSIQISLTRDAARADIDVDYRSSKFPVALLNGHLTAANSDVRVGNNDARHNNQWVGLQNWWRNLLGLPLEAEPVKLGGKVIAQEPKRKDMKPDEAIFDFLNGWLVEQKPNEAIAYVSDQAFACMELEERSNTDRGMAKFVMLQNMASANRRLGKVSSLDDVITGATVSGERIKLIQQGRAAFVMYDVREDLAEEFNCANRLDSAQMSAKAAKSQDFGKYVGAVFRMRAKGRPETTVATLWSKDRGYWKMITYEIDPELDRSTAPKVGIEPALVSPLAFVDGDKDMIKAATDFLKLWLIRKDIRKAMGYVDPDCLQCVNVYHPDEKQAASTGARELLMKGMSTAAETVGKLKRLDEGIVAPQVSHEDLKLVKHADDRAFVIASVPDHMGEAAKCDRRNADGDPEFASATKQSYGKYYAVGFHIEQGKTSPAVLWMLWSRVNGAWKAVSYVLVTP